MSDPPDQLFRRCTNCGAVFSAFFRMTPADFESATIEEKHYQCPVCANFDTYDKADHFYDDD